MSFSRGYFTIRNGLRLTAYKAYLENERQRTNLHILTHALVYKVEFDDKKRAVAVWFRLDGKERRARASKEIIISAGAINSPKILQLSGIGPKKILDRFNIPVIHDLRGVGGNLQNHIYISGLQIALKDVVGMRVDEEVTAENFEELETRGEGPLAFSPRLIAMALIDSEYANKSIDWPDLEFEFDQFLGSKQFLCANKLYSYASHVVIRPTLLRPKSVGEVVIKSVDAVVPPTIKFNYLSEEDDVKILISGIKIFLQISATKAMKKVGAFVPPFPVIKSCEGFRLQSDEYLECYVRTFYASFHHVTGTCKMGVKDDVKAVVDSKLRVYGVRNLRIVDNSVSPTVITGHTMAVSYMIGEKAADIIKRAWRQKKPNKKY